MPSAAVVGPGRAGTHLASALEGAGWDVVLCGRGAPVPQAEVTVLAVRDAEIEEVAGDLDAPLMAHLSGLHGPLPRVRLALHPAMTFPAPARGPVSLEGVGFALTAADDEAAAWGRRMAADLGGKVVELSPADRPRYHAACALASNVLVTLEEAASLTLSDCGVPDPRAHLGPLVAATVANWRVDGPAALSGPVVRGDWATVDCHLAELDGPARAFYQAALAGVGR